MRISSSIGILGLVAAVVTALAVTQLVAGPASPDAATVIEATAKAYQDAKALTDTVAIRIKQPGGTAEDELTLAIDASGDIELSMQGFVFTQLGESLYIHQKSRPTKYVKVPLEKNLLATMSSLTDGQASFPAPQLMLRQARSMDEYMNAFGLGLVGNLSLTGHEEVTVDGTDYDELHFDADHDVKVIARVNATSHLLSTIELKNPMLTYTFTMHPKVMKGLPQSIRFDAAGRRQVEDLSKLALGEGDPAPDFTLPDLDGKTVTLSELRGNVVVLDFWATWCGPCKRGLPLLQQFADWAEEGDHAVRVFAVNMGENHPTREQKREAVAAFWKGRGFGIPTLMDYDDRTAREYQVGPIPHTVIVGPDGRIVKVKIGFDPNMVKLLQETATKALDSVG